MAAAYGQFGTAATEDVTATDTQPAITITNIAPVMTALADGGTEAVYTYPDGEVQTVMTPPTGFDPLGATPDQLSLYDFPPRPADDDPPGGMDGRDDRIQVGAGP